MSPGLYWPNSSVVLSRHLYFAGLFRIYRCALKRFCGLMTWKRITSPNYPGRGAEVLARTTSRDIHGKVWLARTPLTERLQNDTAVCALGLRYKSVQLRGEKEWPSG